MPTLKSYRKTAALSQIELAQLSGISRFRLQQAEAGFLELTGDELLKIKTVIRQRLAAASTMLTEDLDTGIA